MKTSLLLAPLLIVPAACFALVPSDQPERPPARSPAPERDVQPRPIELSGRLQRPVKWYPQLELAPAGQIRRFDLQGPALNGIPAGMMLRVRGVVRSRLHTGGTPENPSPAPAQWLIWLEVTEVEVLEAPGQKQTRSR